MNSIDENIVVMVSYESVEPYFNGSRVFTQSVVLAEPMTAKDPIEWSDDWNPWRALYIGRWRLDEMNDPLEVTP